MQFNYQRYAIDNQLSELKIERIKFPFDSRHQEFLIRKVSTM
jgi:hypothetical protein